MSKIAFIFPGQGAQYVGMGKDFYEQILISREMFQLAGEAGGLDIEALCFEENDKINITEYTQIAMLAAEVAMLKAVEEKGIKPDVVPVSVPCRRWSVPMPDWLKKARAESSLCLCR